MIWNLCTSMRPSDPLTALDDMFHAARFGGEPLNRPTHQALDMHRLVQFAAVNGLSRETNAAVVVESTGEVDNTGLGSYRITITIGGSD